MAPQPKHRGATGAIAGIVLSIAVACGAHSQAVAADNLYRAQAIVTGQGEANRMVGFSTCLEDVLIRVSGALKLAGDPRLEPYKAKARDFVKAYDYRDQMSGTPKRDEQGTRDRPYDLIVDFDESRIDRLLSSLGFKPWTAHRPSLGVLVAMEQGSRHYMVTADAKQSDLQRESLAAAAAKRGMTIVLPDAAALEKANVSAAQLTAIPSPRLAAITGGQGSEVVLVGRLTWNDEELGWITDWQMDLQGRPHRWQIRRVNFDEAFRNGLGGAAQILSGNGDPG